MRTQVTKNSRLAHSNALKSGAIASMHTKILGALKKLKFGTTSDISEYLNMPEHQIHKRLSEMQAKELIRKTEYSKRSKSTGQLQAVWALYNFKVSLICKK